MSEERDYYSVLQVSRKATSEEIDRAYERLTELYGGQSKKRHAAERLKLIQEAFDTLSDVAQRADYDRSVGSGLAAPGFGGGETIVTKFLSSRYGLPAITGLVAAVAVAAVIVSVFSGGDDGVTRPTPVPVTSSDDGPPPVTGEEVTTDTGLTYIEVTQGTGASPLLGDTVLVNYTGWLESDGTKFDSSFDSGGPIDFVLGRVIEGWNEGLQLMKEGGTTRLIIPGDLAYGPAGSGTIPPDATLVFDVELITVTASAPTPDAAETTEPTTGPTDSAEPSATSGPTSTSEPE